MCVRQGAVSTTKTDNLGCRGTTVLRWFGHLVRMPAGCLPRELFQGRPAGKSRDLGEDQGLGGEIISQHWPRERLGIPLSELVNVAREW